METEELKTTPLINCFSSTFVFKLTDSVHIGPDVEECWLFSSSVRLCDLDLLDEFERLEDVGDVVETSDSRLHDRVGQANAVDHFRGKVKVDLCVGLMEKRNYVSQSRLVTVGK